MLTVLFFACTAPAEPVLGSKVRAGGDVEDDTHEPEDTGDSEPVDTGDSAPVDTGDSVPADTGWDPAGDSDGDGISDGDEGRADDDATSRDSDGDGLADYLDPDSDEDGISDLIEGTMDTDSDGIADSLDTDSDDDGLLDADEGMEDWDGDGIDNWRDAMNDTTIGAIKLIAISTDFTSPIGIDFHESGFDVVTSVYYSSGVPYALELVAADGTHAQFSSLAGVTDEVKIATVRSGGMGGFTTGELFVGNGVDGQIVRVSEDGTTVTNPWVDLPGGSNGLMRGSLYVDRTGVFDGDLIVATTIGEVWRIDSLGTPTLLATIAGTHLEGLVTVPDAPGRFGPLAGQILAGAENEGLMYSIAVDGTVRSWDVGVNIEDIDIIEPNENFFGINYGTSSLLGTPSSYFLPNAGDILLTQESVGVCGLFRLYWNGSELHADELSVTADSATVGQWEHVTFAGAGIQEVP